jgi:drug/metabolite transporter (DMT)-like permease
MPGCAMLAAENGTSGIMFAISLGVFAALCWSFHDLVAKIYAERIGPYRMAFWVMLAGAAALLPVVVWRGALWTAPGEGLLLASLMGVVYAGAVAGLFKGFSLAPISIVGPFTSGYPALVIFWHLYQGLHPTPLEWLALALALAGALVVARTGPADGGLNAIAPGKLPVVIGASLFAAVCFASTIIMGQEAARLIGQYETTFVSRFPAALALLPLMLRDRVSNAAITRPAGFGLIAMAALDVAAVSAINAAGFFPGAEYSSMGISLYGAIAVVLATLFLKDKVTLPQWLGIAMIVASVALLGWPKS